MKGGAIANFVCPLGRLGTPMKGGAIANVVYPLAMIGKADEWGSYLQFCVPLSVWLGTPMNGGAIANLVCPLGMVGNADGQITSPRLCAQPFHDRGVGHGDDWGGRCKQGRGHVGTVHNVD